MSEKAGGSLPPINEKDQGGGGADDTPREKWAPKQWTFFKKSSNDLKKMAPQQKSRYMAHRGEPSAPFMGPRTSYDDPPKDAASAQAICRQRLIELRKERHRENQRKSHEELDERDKHEKLIGQLKAAEARNRIRIMRLRYESNRAAEVNHLIMCQPTARKAVRLQALLPARGEDHSQGDALDKISRGRIEALLEDTRGLLTGRT